MFGAGLRMRYVWSSSEVQNTFGAGLKCEMFRSPWKCEIYLVMF